MILSSSACAKIAEWVKKSRIATGVFISLEDKAMVDKVDNLLDTVAALRQETAELHTQLEAWKREVDALQETVNRLRMETLAEASQLGYLDHRPDCRKGKDSETCTCGIMAWIPRDPDEF